MTYSALKCYTFLRFGGMPEPALMPVVSERYRKLQDYFDVMILRDLVEQIR